MVEISEQNSIGEVPQMQAADIVGQHRIGCARDMIVSCNITMIALVKGVELQVI